VAPAAGKGIYVGSADVGVSLDAQIAPALIIGQDDDHVGFLRLPFTGAGPAGDTAYKAKGKQGSHNSGFGDFTQK
jgi:hypothetical protein